MVAGQVVDGLARRLLPGRKRAAGRADEVADSEFLEGFRAGERIIVMRGEEHEIVAVQRALDHHRRGEAAVDRDDRIRPGERQDEALLGLGQHHQLLGAERAAPARMHRNAQRDRHRQLFGLAGGDGDVLLEGQDEALVREKEQEKAEVLVLVDLNYLFLDKMILIILISLLVH